MEETIWALTFMFSLKDDTNHFSLQTMEVAMNIPAAIEVLTIFAKYETSRKAMNICAEHDSIFLGNPSWKISEDDMKRLTTLGLHLTENGDWVFYT